MLHINDVNIGDILLHKDFNTEYLIIDGSFCEDAYYTILYLRKYDEVKDALNNGNMIRVDSYNNYTITIEGCDRLYLEDTWKFINHIEIETIRYFKLRGKYNG